MFPDYLVNLQRVQNLFMRCEKVPNIAFFCVYIHMLACMCTGFTHGEFQNTSSPEHISFLAHGCHSLHMLVLKTTYGYFISVVSIHCVNLCMMTFSIKFAYSVATFLCR